MSLRHRIGSWLARQESRMLSGGMCLDTEKGRRGRHFGSMTREAHHPDSRIASCRSGLLERRASDVSASYRHYSRLYDHSKNLFTLIN
jgi:hypothetical protein